MYSLLVLISLVACICIGQQIWPDCVSGEYSYTPRSGHPVCRPCTPGETYMPENNHNNTQCYNCTQIKDRNLEKIQIECNKDNNTVIVCIPGYFRNTENDTCELCQSCNYTVRQCQNFSNSVCCPGENYNFIDGACQIFCPAGEYLSEEKCLPCKDGYFNSNSAHRNTSCAPCQEPDRHLHLEVKEACNKTHNTKLVCMKNYYMSEPVSLLKSDECDNCRNCSVYHEYVGRNCSDTTDTVCCQKPGMIVTDSSVCVENVGSDTTTTASETTVPGSITCDKEHYLDIDSKDTNTSCLPCRKGTFQDKENHTDTQCKNCTEYTGSQVPETCQAQDHENSKLSDLIICVIVIGPVIFIIFIIIGIIFIYKRRRQGQRIKTVTEQIELNEIRDRNQNGDEDKETHPLTIHTEQETPLRDDNGSSINAATHLCDDV